jgi:hypothetical protein
MLQALSSIAGGDVGADLGWRLTRGVPRCEAGRE